VMIDSFERVSCSEIRMHVDQFMAQIAADPNTVGVVALSDDDPFVLANNRRALLENHMLKRRFNMTRIQFVRRTAIPSLAVQFWKAGDIKELAFDHTSHWNYRVEADTKPFIVYTDGFNESECLFPSGASVLKDYLLANPGSRGNIVIRCSSTRCYEEQKKMILNELSQTNAIPMSRIRFFYVPIASAYFENEYWLLP
jgi:hypothetical protein